MLRLVAAVGLAMVATAPQAKEDNNVLLFAGHRTAGGGGGTVMAVSPSDGTMMLIANTSVLPDAGVGMAFDGTSLYFQGFDGEAGRNAFVTTSIRRGGRSSSIRTLRNDNVFDFEFDSAGKLYALSATAGNLSVGRVDTVSGNFTAVAAVDNNLDLLMGSTFDPAGSDRGGGTFVLLSHAKGNCVIVSAALDPAVPTAVSSPVQGLLGPVAMYSIALLPPVMQGGSGGTVVGIGQSEAHPSAFFVVQVNHATAAPTQPPVLLNPGPPEGSSVAPIYVRTHAALPALLPPCVRQCTLPS